MIDNLIFLHGGGDHPVGRAQTLTPFIEAAAPFPGPLALIVAEANVAHAPATAEAYLALFADLAAQVELVSLYATPDDPLSAAAVSAVQPAGIFVCGGVTPVYHQALCADQGWLAYLHETGIPFGGTSAGAAIAAQRAILGGWRAAQDGRLRDILFRGAGEGLDALTVADGLGLVPFAVDVHASQMGTLSRLIHAVTLGLVNEGWAIDENTLLTVRGGDVTVHGLGHAYHVTRAAGTARVTVHWAG